MSDNSETPALDRELEGHYASSFGADELVVKMCVAKTMHNTIAALQRALAEKDAALRKAEEASRLHFEQAMANGERAQEAEAELDALKPDVERYQKLKKMFDHGGVTIRLIGEVDKLGIPLVTYEYTEWEQLQSAIARKEGA